MARAASIPPTDPALKGLRLIEVPEVKGLTGYSDSLLASKIADRSFPQPLTARPRRWHQKTIEEYLENLGKEEQ